MIAPVRVPYRLKVLCAVALLAAVGPVMAGHDHDGLADLVPAMLAHPFVLLGEVHDNPEGHRKRLRLMEDAVRKGWRPVLAMEQFDTAQQAALDTAMRECTDADCVIDRTPGARSTAWDWDQYKPVIDLALRLRLSLRAANLSRDDARRVMHEGLQAVFTQAELRDLRLEHGPPPDLLAAQMEEVAAAHCGRLPASLRAGMAMAQIARDATMASVLLRAAGPAASSPRSTRESPVILLAGNGHVRTDMGVPQWLPREQTYAVGFTEQPAPLVEFDADVGLKHMDRPDPCDTHRRTLWRGDTSS